MTKIQKVVRGKIYTGYKRIRKMSDIPIDVPHIVVSKFRFRNTTNRYGSFVVEVQNEDNGERFQCYMPKYVGERCREGEVFIYDGLRKENDKSGHTYHSVMWR